MNAALYATIWVSLALFVLGEAGKSAAGRSDRAPLWAWRAWTLGAMLCTIHILISMGARYDWSHDAAIAATGRQTADVFGVELGRSVYVNYVFVAIWLADASWWRVDPAGYAARSRGLTWLLCGFYFVILANAAVIFARPSWRWLGVALLAVLLWTWFKAPQAAEP